MIILIFVTTALFCYATGTEVPQGETHRPHYTLHHKRDSETKYNPDTVTMSPLQIAQIVTAAKATFESLSKMGKSDEKFTNEIEYEEIEELWACTEASLKLETCFMISSFKMSLKQVSCHDLHLRIVVYIEGRFLELFLTQKKRMLSSTQEKSATCTQRLKKYPINDGFQIVILDNKIQKVGTDEIESHIFWTLLKSYDIVDCFLFKIGVLDLEKNEFFKFKLFTIMSALVVWTYSFYHAKVKFSKYWSKKSSEKEEEDKKKKKEK